MFSPLLWSVVLLSVVQGVTEFLPVSSTGHLILMDYWTGFESALGGKDKVFVFDIFIQLGAILAILAQYGCSLGERALGVLRASRQSGGIFLALIVGTIPLVVLGMWFGSEIKERFFHPVSVAWAFILGGKVMWVIESIPLKVRVVDTFKVGWREALWIGLAQTLALFPGTSRSGATIMGGLCAGLDRRTATEFSFILAFPALFAATVYSLVKYREQLDFSMWGVLLLGLAISFLTSWAVIRWLLVFVKNHNFKIFAVYRIVFGVVLLWLSARSGGLLR